MPSMESAEMVAAVGSTGDTVVVVPLLIGTTLDGYTNDNKLGLHSLSEL